MSVNIMDLVKGAVSDQIMGQLGGLLGTDAKKTPGLFETAAGSILGGLMKKGSTSQGAQDIFGAVQNQDDGILDKLGDLLGGGDSTDEFQKQGGGILDLITGGGQQSSGMIEMVAKALGLDQGIVGKLLMMAAPIVMGVIGKHMKSKALDAVGLGDLLGSQGPNLAGVMPSSLTSGLGIGNLLGQAGDAVGNAAGAVGNMGNAAAGAVGNAASRTSNAVGNAADSAASAGGSVLKYIIPLGLLVLAAVFFGPKIMDAMSRSTPAIDTESIQSSVEGAIPDLGNFDLSSMPGLGALGESGTKLTEGMSGIQSALRDVTDDAGASTLAEKITGFTGQLDGFGLDSLEGPAKTTASTLIGKFVDIVKGLIGGKSESVQGILKPVVDTLMEKLSAFQ